VENLQVEAKRWSRKFFYVRDCATAAGDIVDVDIASNFVEHPRGLREEFVFSRNHQNSLDVVINFFVVPVENVAVCTQDDGWPSERFWTKYVFETNTIFSWKCMIVIQMFAKKLSKTYFSSPTHIYVNLDCTPLLVKTKNRNRLEFTLEDDHRCALSTTQPRIDNLVENVTQEQKLHWSLSRNLLSVADAKIK